MIEIRKSGSLVARAESSEKAQALAKAIFGEGAEGVTVEPGLPFELHCRDGFISSYESEEQAEAALRSYQLAHALNVERGGPADLKKRRPGVQLGAMHDDKDPELVIIKVKEPHAPEFQSPEIQELVIGD